MLVQFNRRNKDPITDQSAQRLLPWIVIAGVLMALVVVATFYVYGRLERRAPGLQVPTTSAEFWAMVQAVMTIGLLWATSAVLLGGLVGLASLSLTKRGLILTARRQAREKSIELAREFCEVLIPSYNTIQEFLQPFQVKDDDVRFADEEPKNKEYERSLRGAAAKWVAGLRRDEYNQTIGFLNKLEVWAMPMVQQIADAKVLRAPCEPVLVSMVVLCYPMLIHLRQSPGCGDFPNLVRLFEAWTCDNTKTEQQLRAQMANAFEALKQNRRRRANKALDEPIGQNG